VIADYRFSGHLFNRVNPVCQLNQSWHWIVAQPRFVLPPPPDPNPKILIPAWFDGELIAVAAGSCDNPLGTQQRSELPHASDFCTCFFPICRLS
jgi:hypothetical protein